MSQKSTKALITLTAVLMLLPIPGLSVTNCIQQNKDFLENACTLCFESRENSFGTCSPYRTDPGCAQSSSSSLTGCNICKPTHYFDGSYCHLITSNAVSSCVRHEDSASNPNCLECTNGIPASNLKSCAAFNTASGAEAPFVANCASGVRSSSGGSARCGVCNNGFAIETTTDKCASTTTTGCWKMTNGVCISCRAWDGYFADGFADTTGRPASCQTQGNQVRNTIGVGAVPANVDAQLTNSSLTEAFPDSFFRTSILREYVEYDGGYISINWKRNFVTNSLDGGLNVRLIEEADLGLAEGEALPYFGSAGTYSNSYRTAELFKCFYFKKMCLIVNDISENNQFSRQELFIFNVANPAQNGVIFKNNEVSQGKYLTSIAPITKSNYVILGFGTESTSSTWSTLNPKVLLRMDYLDTTKQFEYTIPGGNPKIVCHRILYIDYSKFFVASFSRNNGALVYDFTQTTQAPGPSKTIPP